MRISNISNAANFKGVTMDKSFLATATKLAQDSFYQKDFAREYLGLKDAAKDREIVIQSISLDGAMVYEVDKEGKHVRDLGYDRSNAIFAISTAKDALRAENLDIRA